ncbi:MAG: hypothetical protein CVU34_11040 [Betaproteobacteria bacterium HGW-Betaproteobacteria-7]|nr:MAG: hypothetical protein CVU34_11040 [Betaproteobacteria bacterium HGW-Betaproteobacteria-7]
MTGQIALRLGGLLLLVLFCLVALATWIKELANDRARAIQLASAREHYAVVLTDLDRRWGREAFNLKTRIEAQEILDASGQRNEKLLTYLISHGSSIEFPSLRIEKTNGEVIAAYDYARHVDPKVKLSPNQLNTWIQNADDGKLYLVIRQFIWLGKENGYLVLFKPMDHAMLTQITYPGTRLSLWWQGKALASSDGEEGLAKTSAGFAKPENGEQSATLSWTGPETELTPRLLVEMQASDLIMASQIARPVVLFFFVTLISVAIAFASLWLRATRQLDALLQADKRFGALGAIDESVAEELRHAQTGPVESLRQLADSLERHMSRPPAGSDSEGSSYPPRNN